MRASILILTLLFVMGLPLQAGHGKYRRQASHYGPGVVVSVHAGYRTGPACLGPYPARIGGPCVHCGNPCAKYRSHKKYRKCVIKQQKKWRKHCRKHPYACSAPYLR